MQTRWRTKATAAAESGLRGEQEGAAETWGSPVHAGDMELGTLEIDVLSMSAWCLCAGRGRELSGKQRKENPFFGPEPFSPRPTRSPFGETKGLLRKLPTVSKTQRDSWGSYLLPSILSKTSKKSRALFSPREVQVHVIFPAPRVPWDTSVALIQLRRGQRGRGEERPSGGKKGPSGKCFIKLSTVTLRLTSQVHVFVARGDRKFAKATAKCLVSHDDPPGGEPLTRNSALCHFPFGNVRSPGAGTGRRLGSSTPASRTEV